MKTPRRVPWATRDDLSELHEWLFAPTADRSTRSRALARMSIYLSSPSCPTFIHLSHTLVAADLLPEPKTAAEVQSLRLTCGLAVVRFVNGMVDPLQSGPFARPISHLAATLQIPPVLINLRHRATHEDLPTLPILRRAVIQALNYLHTYSFLPLLASTSNAPVREATARTGTLVGRFKKLMKDRLRDREVGEDTPGAKELRRVRRMLETEQMDDVVEALCSTEGLVPQAKRELPNSSLLLWTPLLSHLAAVHPDFLEHLADAIVSAVLHPMSQVNGFDSEEVTRQRSKDQQSVRWTLAVWLLWLWSAPTEIGELELTSEAKAHIISKLMAAVLHGDSIIHRLVGAFSHIDPLVRSMWPSVKDLTLFEDDDEQLSGFVDSSDGPNLPGLEQKLLEMEKRINEMQSVHSNGYAPDESAGAASSDSAPGWKKLSGREWRACPIGVWPSM